jgi:hypothetical protein
MRRIETPGARPDGAPETSTRGMGEKKMAVVRSIERLMQHVAIQPDGCWLWTGPFNGDGDGRLRNGERTERAHCYSFALHGGTFTRGRCIHHSCGVRACVNPAHLYAAPQAPNYRPLVPVPRSIERITSNVDMTESGCWEWRGHRSPDGYGRVCHNGRCEPVHRYSFLAHGGEMLPGQSILHACDNPPCVNPDHLRAGTTADNMRDKVERGRQARGESSGRTTLTNAQVVEIRERFAAGEMQRELGAEFGVTQCVVSAIVRGKWWRHVGGPITHRKGHRPRKLSDAQVAALRARVAEGVSQRKASAEFGISNQLVSDIVNNKARVAQESVR